MPCYPRHTLFASCTDSLAPNDVVVDGGVLLPLPLFLRGSKAATLRKEGRYFFFTRTPIAKSTIMGAKISAGIGHSTESISFLMFSPSHCQPRCHCERIQETRSLPFRRHSKAPWPTLEMTSSHRQTTSVLMRVPFIAQTAPVIDAVYCQSRSFNAPHKIGDLRHRLK
jgi:hypothetical protein